MKNLVFILLISAFFTGCVSIPQLPQSFDSYVKSGGQAEYCPTSVKMKIVMRDSIPQYRFSKQQKNDTTAWIYADTAGNRQYFGWSYLGESGTYCYCCSEWQNTMDEIETEMENFHQCYSQTDNPHNKRIIKSFLKELLPTEAQTKLLIISEKKLSKSTIPEIEHYPLSNSKKWKIASGKFRLIMTENFTLDVLFVDAAPGSFEGKTFIQLGNNEMITFRDQYKPMSRLTNKEMNKLLDILASQAEEIQELWTGIIKKLKEN
ncbi:hypothetical protein HN954_00720 [bacterium]|mgnify:CR=1 FL=1|jgi:hypothetical protein|nr:hypothetical protein [bacterium]MBT6832391.1 hypothetical protein [bacterium]MBT6995936.1 hypothetical protein [bacterium]MBT7772797.1 hypothetical protein [bacterium]